MTTKIKQQRIGWVDTLRGIAIFFVLIAHQNLAFPLYRQCYMPFFMPVFFFVSGYLFKYKGIKENIKRIARTLLWPYVIFSYISKCATIAFIRNIQAGTAINYLGKVTNELLFGDTFWFIACLIVVQIAYTFLSAFFNKANNSWKKVVAVVGVLFIYIISREETAYLPWHIDTACYAMGIFAIGDLFKSVDIYRIANNKQWRIVSWCILAMYIATTLIFNWDKFNISIDMNCNIYHNTTICLFFIAFGCVSVILFSICNNCGRFISDLGKNTLVIYCLHASIGFGLSTRLLHLIGIDSLSLSPYIQSLLIAILTGIIMLIASHIINKYFPFLLGKTNKQTV